MSQMLLLLLFLHFLNVPSNAIAQIPSDSNTTSDYNEINNTFKLLEEGERKIELSEQHKNVTIVIGNTGAGKSTFIQWIAGDDSKLIAEEEEEGTSKFTIEDNNDRIGSSSISKTIFPELVIDRKTNAAYYDCPGFSDTRSSSYDIASTYFIKKLADHASNVKIVLVTGYASVSKGVDRQGFIKLLRHTIELIKDIRKFENSFAIVVTKVDNIYMKKDYHLILVPDDKIIKGIANFLQSIKKDLNEKLKLIDIDSKERLFLNVGINLVDILCTTKANIYTRIGIFRRPDEFGPLSNIKLLQIGKRSIEKILNEEINYTKKSNNDFGYTISEKSKNDINVLVEMINDKVWGDISEIANKVQEHYRNLLEDIRRRINTFVKFNTIFCVKETDAQVFINSFNTGYYIISRLLAETITNIEHLGNKIKISIARLGISTCASNIKNISDQGKFFSFLQVVSDRDLNTRPWTDLFKRMEVYFSNSQQNLGENVDRAANEIKNKIKSNTKIIANEIKAHYLKKIESLEFEQISFELNKGFYLMSNLTQEVNNISCAQVLSEKISDNILNSDIDDSSKIGRDTLSIFYYGKYLKFLNILKNGALNNWSSEWIKPFLDAKKYLYESEIWYKFLDALYAKLSEYEVQIDLRKFYAEIINDRGDNGKLHGKVTNDNFQLFLEKVKQYHLKEHDSVKYIELTSSRLQALNDILGLTLGQENDFDCDYESAGLVITGNHIRLSDYTTANGQIKQLCRNGAFNSVDIFSLDTVVIDRDLNETGSKLQITLIAPKWQIKGQRKINLNGASKASYTTIAEEGRYEGASGGSGLPGLPGEPAGNFLGIGGKFINGEHLTITANGGEGGSGQQGGNGRRGLDGEAARRDGGNFERKLIKNELIITVFYNQNIDYFLYYGRRGGVGGNGGHGGAGGLGGKKGEIRVFNFDEKSEAPSVENIPGPAGKDGKGGIGGIGGMQGSNLETDYCKRFVAAIPVYLNWCGSKHVHSGVRSASGANGKDGGNTAGRQQPESTQFQNIARKVNSYKVYLRKKLKDNYFRKHALMQFVSQLENNSDIKRSYDTLGLVSELQDLEKQIHIIQQPTVDFMPFYQSLLNRTSEYARHPRHFEINNSYKKTLSYLYTATLSRMSSLKSGSEPNLIIDLENYLKLVKQNIESLTDLKEKSNRINVINQYKQSYKNYIDKKIEEAEFFINNQVTHEIDNINSQVADKIDLLIIETLELQKQAKKEKEQLVEKKRELEKALTLSWVSSGLKIFGQVVGCFGPLGAAVSSIVDSTTQVTESLSLRGQGADTLRLPEGVVSTIQSIQRKIVTINDQKFTRFKKLLEKISLEVNEHPEQLSDTSEEVKGLMRTLQTAQNSSDVNKIKELQQELRQELSRKASALKIHKYSTDNKIAKATAVITKLNQAMQFGMIGFDIYGKYRNDEQKTQVMDEALQQAEEKIQQLEQYESKIYEEISPMLIKLGNDLNYVGSQLSNKSQVALDVTNWQVQSFLKDMNMQMRQFTKGFAVEGHLGRLIEKLEETMTTLINIYDRIYNYQEQKQLAVYIADISSPVPNQINIVNQTLINAVNELEIIIMSNLVVEQYKFAVNALTQQVFPFGHRYLSEIKLPSYLQMKIDFQDLVTSAGKQVKVMQSKITEYKTAIKYPDPYISSGWFNRDYVSAQPFFVWENNKYSEVILQLLSGDKIVVKANILDSAFDKDAIKFNEIGIHFSSENSTVTSEVSNKLKGFVVSATHLGNSYYRYSDNIYIITGDNHNIRFSFERDAHGEPVHKNIVYDKIKSGDLMLSPYAMWEFQLINAPNKVSFQELTMYKDRVNLELVGYGSYVTRGTNISNIDLENYYQTAEIISVSALSGHNQHCWDIREIGQVNNTSSAASS